MSLFGNMGGAIIQKKLARTFDKKHKPLFTKKPSSKRVKKKLKEQRANGNI